MKLTIFLLVFCQFLAIFGSQNVIFGSRMDGDSLLYTARNQGSQFPSNTSPKIFSFNYTLSNEVYTSKSNASCFLVPQITYIEVLDESKGVNGPFAIMMIGGVQTREVKMNLYSKKGHPLDITIKVFGFDKMAFDLKCKP